MVDLDPLDPDELAELLQVPGERVIEREAEWSGRPGRWSAEFAAYKDAVAAWIAYQTGEADAFLSRAWVRLALKRPRDKLGRFMPGWLLEGEFVRPAEGEIYSLEPIDAGA